MTETEKVIELTNEVIIIKQMEDYTDEELLALTEDQIKNTVNLECAHAGVRLLPNPPVKPTGKKPDKDVAYFTIGSVDFANQADASEVADLIATKPVITKKYQSGPGYSHMHTGTETNRPSVETHMIFSESYLNEVLLEKTAVEEAEKLYEELRNEYDKISGDRGNIITTLYDMIDEARREKKLHDTLRLEFKKYMERDINPLIVANGWSATQKIRYVTNGPRWLHLGSRLFFDSYFNQRDVARNPRYRKIFGQIWPQFSTIKSS